MITFKLIEEDEQAKTAIIEFTLGDRSVSLNISVGNGTWEQAARLVSPFPREIVEGPAAPEPTSPGPLLAGQLYLFEAAGDVLPSHRHDDIATCHSVQVLSGGATVTIGAVNHALSPGETIEIPIGVEHSVTALRDKTTTLHALHEPRRGGLSPAAHKDYGAHVN